MCSSGQRLCSGSRRSRPSDGPGMGSQYALCALGVGLVGLGIVMILWNMVPLETQQNGTATNGNNDETKIKSTSVAFVLVGCGLVMLLVAICLGLRSKQRSRDRGAAAAATGTQYHIPTERQEPEGPGPAYDVPTYEEAVTSGQYPVRQSNLRQSTSQLPSYEDLIAAVENEGQGPGAGNGQNGPGPQATPPAAGANPPPARSGSRASRIFRPLRVRRIKSERLHIKDVRLKIQSPAQGEQVTIEPLTPPPQYEDKAPEFPVQGV